MTTTYVTSLSTISGFLLNSIRTQMNLNQRQMAKLFNITQGAYGNMERGEASINAEFVFMLSSIVGIKASDYFSLVEEILEYFNERNNDEFSFELYSSYAFTSLVSSDKRKKELVVDEVDNKASIATYNGIIGEREIIYAEDMPIYLSDELKAKIAILSKVVLSKKQADRLINITSEEINTINNAEETQANSDGITTAQLLGTAIAGPLGFLVGSLFKTYKEAKEEKIGDREK